MTFHLYNFSDFSEFLTETQKPDTCYTGKGQIPASQGTNDIDFFGTKIYGEADTLAVTGIPSYESQVRLLADGLEAINSTVHTPTQWQYDVAGDDCDVTRYLTGEPENMVRYESEERQGGKIISLLISGGASSGIGRDKILMRGAAIIALADILENAGYRVEITYGGCCEPYGVSYSDYVTVLIPLKRAQDVLDVTRLTYALCCPAMYRRHVWRWRETLPKQLRADLGWSSEVSDDTRPSDEMASHITHDVYISCQYHDFDSASSAREWIEQRLNALGIQIS